MEGDGEHVYDKGRRDGTTKNSSREEMVTPSYTGNIRGDPRGGKTRLLTNTICEGTNYYLGLGVHANGSESLAPQGTSGWVT